MTKFQKAACASALTVLAVTAGACATKRYPIATPFSQAEAQAMTCRELALEAIRTEQVRAQINNTAQVDWRSAAGFLGDFGIGNAMAKSEADKALSDRLAGVRAAEASKNCSAQRTSGLKRLLKSFLG